MISSDYRADARQKLSGKWGKAACLILANFAIGFAIGFVQNFFPESMQSLLSLAVTIIELPLGFGLIISLMKLFDGEDVKAFDFVSSGFSNFGRAWGISWNIALKMLLPFILTIVSYALIIFGLISSFAGSSNSLSSLSDVSISGTVLLGSILLIVSIIWSIIKSYYYQLAYFVAINNPEMTSKEAVLKSAELMKNRRGKLFCLQFSFIGWIILACFTFGIGVLWLLPYVSFAIISFYKDAIGATTDPIKVEE